VDAADVAAALETHARSDQRATLVYRKEESA